VYDSQLIDLSNGGTAPGTAVLQWSANAGPNQRWTLAP